MNEWDKEKNFAIYVWVKIYKSLQDELRAPIFILSNKDVKRVPSKMVFKSHVLSAYYI